MRCSLVPWSHENLQMVVFGTTLSLDQGTRGRAIAHPLGSDMKAGNASKWHIAHSVSGLFSSAVISGLSV